MTTQINTPHDNREDDNPDDNLNDNPSENPEYYKGDNARLSPTRKLLHRMTTHIHFQDDTVR
jgi:hypothetical protein